MLHIKLTRPWQMKVFTQGSLDTSVQTLTTTKYLYTRYQTLLDVTKTYQSNKGFSGPKRIRKEAGKEKSRRGLHRCAHRVCLGMHNHWLTHSYYSTSFIKPLLRARSINTCLHGAYFLKGPFSPILSASRNKFTKTWN